MKYNIFQSMKESMPTNPNIGDYFLEGVLVKQKETKQIGDPITFYVITNIKKENNIEYRPIYDILEY